MEASDSEPRLRVREIVLDEIHIEPHFFETTSAIGFTEETSRIPKTLWLKDQRPWKWRGKSTHMNPAPMLVLPPIPLSTLQVASKSPSLSPQEAAYTSPDAALSL